MQAAAVHFLVGEKGLRSLQTFIQEISARKLKNCDNEDGLKLLSDFTKQFSDIAKERKSFINDDELFKNLIAIVEFSAKGTFEQFFKFLYNELQTLWKFSGYLVITNLQDEPRAWEIDIETVRQHQEIKLVYDDLYSAQQALTGKTAEEEPLIIHEPTPKTQSQSIPQHQSGTRSSLRALSLVTSNSSPRDQQSTSSCCNRCIIL